MDANLFKTQLLATKSFVAAQQLVIACMSARAHLLSPERTLQLEQRMRDPLLVGSLSIEELIHYGLFTTDEMVLIDQQIAAISEALDRPTKVIKYPWSEPNIDHRKLRVVLRGESWEEGMRALEGLDPNLGPYERGVAKPLSIWLRGKRRLIGASSKSQEVLSQLAAARTDRGLGLCRWSSLPTPGSHLYGEGIMFRWQDNFNGSVITFACSVGDVASERILFRAWASIEATPAWAAGGYRNQWGSLSFPWEINREGFQKEVALQEGYSDDNNGLYYVTLTVNALAAISTEYQVDVLRRPKKGAKRRSRRSLGGVARVRSIDLDPDGLSVWSKRYVDLADPEDYAHSGNNDSDNSDNSDNSDEEPIEDCSDLPEEPKLERGPIALHRRDPTLARVWVHEDNVEPGEFIESDQVRENGRRYCCVWRKRKGGPVGGTVKERRERLRTGIDDLNIPGKDF